MKLPSLQIIANILIFNIFFIDICGGKLTESSGVVDFFKPQGLPTNLVECVWLIQTPASRFVQLNITKFSLQNTDCNVTKLSLFEGLVTSSISSRYEFCSGNPPKRELVMAGPYITVSLVADGGLLSNGGFQLTYRYNDSGQ